MSAKKMNITVLSLTCCNSKLAAFDQQYVSKIKEALTKLNLDAKLEVTSATDALFGLKVLDPKKIWELFDKYGTAIAPVLFINGEVTLYGGVPSVDRLVEVISKAANKEASSAPT
jgi:hypothetical protein